MLPVMTSTDDLTLLDLDGELGVDLGTGLGAQVAARFFRGLADPTRLRVVCMLLERGEMSVSEVVEATGGLQGRVSSHLACLRHCGLVADRKQGRNVYYSVPDPRVRQFVPVALSMIADNAAHIATCHRIGDA